MFPFKKNGSLRFSVDYAITIRHFSPLMDKGTDSLGETTEFSTMDANSGFWKIEIGGRDGNETSFTSHHGLYKFTRIPFRLRNALATFQRAMGVILPSMRWQFSLVYLDDIGVFLESAHDHSEEVRRVQ